MAATDETEAPADLRDRAARQRDAAADARDRAIAQAEAEQGDESHPRTEGEVVIRAPGRDARAEQRRARAAEQRALAAQDRRHAALDREHAARERRDALAEREALVAELRHQRARLDQALRHQHRAEQLARTLQRSLSPPSLPPIEGLAVAVHYEPSAPEEVGGDFYDLFPLTAERVGFFLGDVCGKGPEAAAVTSLARYTMRTAAMLHETPDAVVMDLNHALLLEGVDPIQTCTAVYGEITMSAAVATITLAVAGHPSPMIVRADGSVEPTAAYGTMLGVVEQPTFQTCEIELGRGDAVVVCSDGLHDTTIDGARVDERRIAAVLAGSPHASAQALLQRLTDALRATDRPLRDDVAIMVVQRSG